MPTYEYRCRDCGRDFEVFQRMSDEPVAPCPGCGRAARRLISGGAGLLFKGEGFYITDHRSESYRERAREEAGGGAGDGQKERAEEKQERGAGKQERAGERSERAGERKEGSGTASGRKRERVEPSAAAGRGKDATGC